MAANITSAEISQLISFGFLVEALSPFHNENMLKATQDVLHSPIIVTALSPIIDAAAGSQVNLTQNLGALIAVGQTFPHDNISWKGNVSYAILTGAGFLAILTRLYARQFITKRLRLDDWVALVAEVRCFICSISTAH